MKPKCDLLVIPPFARIHEKGQKKGGVDAVEMWVNASLPSRPQGTDWSIFKVIPAEGKPGYPLGDTLLLSEHFQIFLFFVLNHSVANLTCPIYNTELVFYKYVLTKWAPLFTYEN